MALMNCWLIFESNLLKYSSQRIYNDINPIESTLNEALFNYLFDKSGISSVEIKTSSADVYFHKVFYGFIEICDSYDSLIDIETYINSFPYTDNRILKSRYMK
jgi:hypothetical protein